MKRSRHYGLVVLALLGGAVLAVAACDPFGDKEVKITNAADTSVTYYAPNRDFDQKRVTLAPGETRIDYFLVWVESARPNQVFRVEAEDDQGRFIFCRTYPLAELKQAAWAITIRPGEIQCERTMPSPSPMPSPKGGSQ
jgi:hypothetical protein